MLGVIDGSVKSVDCAAPVTDPSLAQLFVNALHSWLIKLLRDVIKDYLQQS